ncbi:MAG: ORF6N domain-containing protein [Chitinophagales bacterium]
MKVLPIHEHIFEIRGKKVMLDFNLAELYEMETKVLKQAVRRNIDRFPEDFMFQLSENEWNKVLRSQFVTLENPGKGKYTKYLPFAFTEHGVAMLASILNSSKAIQVNISIIRAFIALREFALNFNELSDKISEMEKKYDKQFKDVYEALNYLMQEKQNEIDFDDRTRIGFKK